jgi:hypothetical protein
MNTQKINNIEYVLADDIIKIAPIYSNKCRNGRELIKKHKIIDSIYLKLINDKWVLSDGSSKKFDKIFIKKSITETIPEFKSETKIIDENNIELAPEIIYLEEHEKFKDNEGNIIEIETIGTRKLDGIFFKIKDVMKGFEIPNLNKNILDKKTSFINEEHYKYFNCKKNNKVKKTMYLTYKGFLKIAFNSRITQYNNTQYIIKKWLDNFDKTILKNYTLNIKDNTDKNNIGYVYIISSDILNFVKIGKWCSSIEGLYSRYITYYGKNIEVDYFLTKNAFILEKQIHKIFKHYNITNELFEKKYYNEYIIFIKQNIDKIDIINEIDNSITSENIQTDIEEYSMEMENNLIEELIINNDDNSIEMEKNLIEELIINNDDNIIINNINYISYNYIFENYKKYCVRTRNGRDLIKKYNINKEEYIYSRNIDNKWIITDGKSYKFDRILFKKSFIDLIPKEIKNNENIKKVSNFVCTDNINYFQDNNDNIINIKIYGNIEEKQIYLYLNDVENYINSNLLGIIKNENNNYINGIDYEYFLNEKNKKKMYLTYTGLIKLLFSINEPNNNVKKFIKWATETLFTLHMGTKTQKEELISTTLGVTAKVIREVFNADCHTIPCVYLMTLNTVKELKKSMKIDEKYKDDSIVAKYGFTKDLSRRTGEHIKTYEKIEGCNLKLKHYSYVDPQYISNAETSIKTFMNCFNVKLEYLNEDELVIIPKEMIELVKDKYETIGKKYSGHISELITKLKDMENNYEKMELRYKMENEKLTYENNILKVMNKNEILEKDLEIMKLKYELIKK